VKPTFFIILITLEGDMVDKTSGSK